MCPAQSGSTSLVLAAFLLLEQASAGPWNRALGIPWAVTVWVFVLFRARNPSAVHRTLGAVSGFSPALVSFSFCSGIRIIQVS